MEFGITIYESLTADTIAGVSRDVTSLMTKPLTEPCIERNYHSTIGSAGLPSSMQSVNFKNESLETPLASIILKLSLS